MTRDFDSLINKLKTASLDRDLRNLEPEIWARIEANQSRSFPGARAAVSANGRTFAAPALHRSTAFALAVVIGMVVGLIGAPATESQSEFSVFSIDASGAPSGRLG